MLLNRKAVPITAEIRLAASGNEIASGPTMRMRWPSRSSRSTAWAAISPTSRAETVGSAVEPPPGTIIVLPRIMEKYMAIEGAAPSTVALSSDLARAVSTSPLYLAASKPSSSTMSSRMS
jgi:hypothetical protein